MKRRPVSGVENTMEIYFVGIIVLAFACFAFVAEQLNPFAKPKYYLKRTQWRYGRRVGFAALLCGVGFIVLIQFTKTSTPLALSICATCFAMSWYFIARLVRSSEAY